MSGTRYTVVSRVGTVRSVLLARPTRCWSDNFKVRANIFGGTQHAFARSGFEDARSDQDGWHGCLQARVDPVGVRRSRKVRWRRVPPVSLRGQAVR
ncbi:hypothetical protein PC121_g14169 [Phytophthora cactorum]|nr:hypothetical protein PC121_g14169 [Phytophthora cactorum]KAG4050904.1 hypothetical protein PC123_g13854 [Phytophthora cactorum]